MKNIYIYFYDKLITDKLYNYLKNYFSNIYIFQDTYEISKESIVITDFTILKSQSEKIKISNVVLLCSSEEIKELSKENLQNIIHLKTPIIIKDLLEVLEQKKFTIDNIYKYKDWFLDVNSNILYKNQEVVSLTEKEALVLKEFFKNPNTFINKDYFLKTVWNIVNKNVDTQSLENYISSLRKKFQDYNVNLLIIKEKEGYKIN